MQWLIRIARRAASYTPLGFTFGAALLAFAAPALAQGPAEFPRHPVTLLLPFPPGGMADTVARRLAERLSQTWKQPVIVDNRPGAAGNLGAGIVAKAAPDGHTLLITVSDGLEVAKASNARIGFDPVKDLVPVALASESDTVLVVPPDSPYPTFSAFVAAARKEPGKLNFGSNGTGSSFHLALIKLAAAAGLDITHVPYKGGAQVVTDVIAGRLDATIVTVSLAAPQIKAGKLKALAVASLQRSPSLPDVPTIAESGFPGYQSTFGIGVFAPAGTPPALVTRLNADVRASMANPNLVEMLAAQATRPTTLSADAYHTRFLAETEQLRQFIVRYNLKFE